MAKDPNAARKEAILRRAKHSGNAKVIKYVQEAMFEKMDSAGHAAGIWLEELERDFSKLTHKPQGHLSGFSEKDFDALFMCLYGYARE